MTKDSTKRVNFARVTCLLLCIIIVAIVGARMRWPSPLVAIVRVVDSAGRPVAGAVIKPYALRAKNDPSNPGWGDDKSVPPTEVTTDDQGLAKIPYPRYAFEKLETGSINLSIEHLDFCPDVAERVVDSSPPANAPWKVKARYWVDRLLRRVAAQPAPIVLQRGGIVKVSGFIGTEALAAKSLHPQLSVYPQSGDAFWRETSDGGLISKRIPDGPNHLRLVHVTKRGESYFSAIVEFTSKAGEAKEFHLELKPGLRVSGKLDGSVPRPVNNGYVVARSYPGKKLPGARPVEWNCWAPVSPDGRFVLDSVPPGTLNLTALCDGFLSKDAATNSSRGHRLAQSFSVMADGSEIEIAMEPGASAEVKILNERGQPVKNATVAFSPNVDWTAGGCTIFAEYSVNSADFLRASTPAQRTAIRRAGWRGVFQAVTDSNGVALIRNLPAEKLNFQVWHNDYDLAVDDLSAGPYRMSSVTLVAGQTNRATATMKKKGTDFVTHQR